MGKSTIWLVVWNIFYFFIQLGRIIPTDEVIFFRGVGIPPTSNGDAANNCAFHTCGASHDYAVKQIQVRGMVKRWTPDGFPFIFLGWSYHHEKHWNCEWFQDPTDGGT